MKKAAKSIAIGAGTLALALLLITPSVVAQEPAQPTPLGQFARSLNPLNWSMPQWKMPNFRSVLPGSEEKARIKKKKDGLFDEVGKTASNSWSKTKAALDPQKLNPVNFFTASSRTPAASSARETKPGFFRSLFSPPPEPQQDTTVTGFLRQPRPGS